MLHTRPSPGGNFKIAAQLGSFNHGHASQMAHIAAARRNVASALSGPAPLQAGPAMPAAPPTGVVMAPPQTGNFKAHIAHRLHVSSGAKITHNAVLSAIDRLQAKGGFTPLQAAGLKKHNGPLHGPEGAMTMASITDEVAGGSDAK